LLLKKVLDKKILLIQHLHVNRKYNSLLAARTVSSFNQIFKSKLSQRRTNVLRIDTSFLETENNLFNDEIEKLSLGDGMCFGEWALIYDIARSASAYTLEDSHLFYLDKEFFDISFRVSISKSDIEKSNFITKKLPALKFSGRIQEFLGRIIPLV
jgi:hypothetical protein